MDRTRRHLQARRAWDSIFCPPIRLFAAIFFCACRFVISEIISKLPPSLFCPPKSTLEACETNPSTTAEVCGGYREQSLVLVKEPEALGVDLIDVPSGGLSPEQNIALGPGCQMPFAQGIPRQASMRKVGNAGVIDEAARAQEALES